MSPEITNGNNKNDGTIVKEVDELNFETMQKDKELMDSSMVGPGGFKTGGEITNLDSSIVSPKKEKNSSSTQVHNPV